MRICIRKLITPIIFSALCTMNAACTPWPIEGTGGFAERRSSVSPELSDLANRLKYAIEQGARTSYAAQTAEAELQLTRAQRTWDAGFIEDYTKNYQILEVLVRDIESHGTSTQGPRKRIN